MEWQGRPVTAFESDKARALFCYLLLEARPIRREQLAGLFWGEQPEPRARGNLSRVLTNLRELFPGCLTSDRGEVAFAPPTPPWIDVHALRAAYHAVQQTPESAAAQAALSDALELYRGPLLAGFSLPGCPEFEEWQRIQQEHWHTLALSAWDLQTAYHRQRGEWAAAIACARRALELEPWRESAHRQVMLLLTLQGERDGALRQYEQCRRLLETELGVAPAPETEALYRRIAAGDAGEAEAALTPAPLATLLPLVGREDSHAWLLARWDAARRGAGGLTLLAGAAGIGKTRLIQETLRLIAGQGGRVLRGRCYEFNRALPYQAIHEALQPALEAAPPGSPLAQLLRPAADVPAERGMLFAAIAAWLRAVRPGSVLFLDDLHWADADTLDLLHYLARNLGNAPCWLIGAYRPGETPPDHPLPRLMQTLNRDALLHTLPLTPLSVADVAQLAARLFVEATPALADYLFRESEGNPFYVAELLETLREQGVVHVNETGWTLRGDLTPAPLPARVQDIILQRVARLGETAQYLLTLAAAHGQPLDADLLAAAGECAPAEVTAALAEWQARQLARPVAGEWDVAHDKIRAALYQAVPAPLRHLLHARLAAALEALQPQAVALLAHHFDRAQQPIKAAHYLLLAGDQARRAYAHEQALAAYRRGLELTPAPELRYALLSGLESIHDMAARRAEQHRVLAELAALVENGSSELRDPRHQMEVALRQAHYAEATGDYPAATAAAERAVTLAQSVGDEALLAAGYRQWGYALRRQEGPPAAARQLYEQARSAAERAGAKTVLADALQGLANVAWNQGEYGAAQAYLEQSLALCQELGDQRGEADAYNILGIVAQRQSHWLQAREHYTSALELRRAIGDRRAQGLSHNNLGSIAYELGDYAAAQTAYTEAATLCREADDRWGAAIAALGLSWVALDQGDLARAQAYAEEGLRGLRQVGASLRAAQAEYTLGLVAQVQGDADRALAHITQAITTWRSLDHPELLPIGLSVLAQLWAVQGDTEQARAALAEALNGLERDPLPDGVVRPLRAHWQCYQALVALDDPRAEVVLERARGFLHARAAQLPGHIAELFLNQIPEHRGILAVSHQPSAISGQTAQDDVSP